MKKYFDSAISRLRLFAILEGISLLILVFIAIPKKYYFNDPLLVKLVGPIHGALFLLFIFAVLHVSVEEKWSFKKITWKVLLACIIPFGTFFIDYKVLSKIQVNKKQK